MLGNMHVFMAVLGTILFFGFLAAYLRKVRTSS